MSNKHFVVVIYLISNTECIKFLNTTENTLHNEHFRSTILYPVDNTTISQSKAYSSDKIETTVWKINTSYTSPHEFKNQTDGENIDAVNEEESKQIKEKDSIKLNKISEVKEENKIILNELNVLQNKANASKDFKPSALLESFYDTLEQTNTQSPFVSFTKEEKKPEFQFIRSPKNEYLPNNVRFPNEFLKDHRVFPYKLEKIVPNFNISDWQIAELQSKPTIEVPLMIPAGGMYESPQAFKEKPASSGDLDDFALELFGKAKEHGVRKRVNPWTSILHMVTALLPVGLIISALTPTIINVENSGSSSHQLSRRSRSGDSVVPNISERCKRRLLCEIHADYIYNPSSPAHQHRTPCHKIRCDDPQALSKVLYWLISYGNSHENTRKLYG